MHINCLMLSIFLLCRAGNGLTPGGVLREVGPMSDLAPDFPLAAAALAPLRAKSEMAGSADFTPLWSGQAAHLRRELPAAELTKQLATETLEKLRFQTLASADVLLAKAASL